MNDFWEWRNSTREFEGSRKISRRGKGIYITIGAVLLIAFFVGLAILNHLGI